MKTLYQLYCDAARALCGREVELRFETPGATPYCDVPGGKATKTPAGKIVIQVAWHETQEAQMRAFLHECAHVQLKHLEAIEQKRATYPNPKFEEQTERLAAEWENYGRHNAMAVYWKAGNLGYIGAQLCALAGWKPVLVTKEFDVRRLRK